MMNDRYLAKEYFEKAHKVLVVSHRKPDGDTLGTAIALKVWLEANEKDVDLACVDVPSKVFGFLPHIKEFQQDFDLDVYDLVAIVDAGASYMTDFHLKYPDFLDTDIPIINIDHHTSNDYFGKINVVDPSAASATLILFELYQEWGVVIDEDIATCLLTGLYTDTGSFMHSNTDGRVMRAASILLESGGRIEEITQHIFRTKQISTLKLWGEVLEKATVTDDNVVMSVVREGDYGRVNADPGELTGVIDYLNMVPDSRFAVLINEDREGNVKGSLRTRNSDIDLSRVAAVFGGGGHAKASGFKVPGKLKEEMHYSIVSGNMSKKSLEF